MHFSCAHLCSSLVFGVLIASCMTFHTRACGSHCQVHQTSGASPTAVTKRQLLQRISVRLAVARIPVCNATAGGLSKLPCRSKTRNEIQAAVGSLGPLTCFDPSGSTGDCSNLSDIFQVINDSVIVRVTGVYMIKARVSGSRSLACRIEVGSKATIALSCTTQGSSDRCSVIDWLVLRAGDSLQISVARDGTVVKSIFEQTNLSLMLLPEAEAPIGEM